MLQSFSRPTFWPRWRRRATSSRTAPHVAPLAISTSSASSNPSGIAVLLVEQNAEMAQGVAAAGTAAELLASDAIRRAYLGVG
jgi:ABC-type branched-subunit amino acid transport system ATPase component